MIKIKYKRIIYIVFTLGICVSLIAYVILRSYHLSFTYDEAASYFLINGNANPNSANNHILNTFLMRICSSLFGNSELALRLPNVLSFGLYIVGCFLILRNLKNKWFAIVGGSLLLFNPIIIEFFSLARGYGISIGFLMLSLYFLLRRNFNYSSYKLLIRDFTFSMFFAILAIFANLTTVNYYIAILAIFIIQYLLLSRQSLNLSYKTHLSFVGIALLTCIPLYFCIIRLLLLSELHELYFGVDFIEHSLNSLIFYSLYLSEYPSLVFVLIKLGIIVSLPLGILSMFIKRPISKNFLIITSLLIILIIGLIVEHYLFDSRYPYGRTALYFIPIFSLYIYYFLEHIIQFFNNRRQSLFSAIFCIAVFIPLIFHLSSNLNLKRTKTWPSDAPIKNAMKIIDEYKEDRNITFSNNWVFEQSINYYIDSRKMNLEPTNKSGVDSTTDFIYEFSDSLNFKNYEPLIKYEDIGTSLFIKTEKNNK